MLVHFLHDFNLFLPLKYGIQIDVKCNSQMIHDERKQTQKTLQEENTHTHIYKKNSLVLKLQINATKSVYFKGALLIIKPQGTSMK